MQQFMELEPVAELEEDSGAEEDSPMSLGSPSISPQPYPGDMWAEVSLAFSSTCMHTTGYYFMFLVMKTDS
jgi:hypothetical protein